MAARPSEAIPAHATAKARASTIDAATARGALPRRMCAIAREIKIGWWVRNKNNSLRVTGKVSRYSRKEKVSRSAAATPKLQRHAISARPNEG